MQTIADRYRWFREHMNMYISGKSAECAMALARAEAYAEERGWFFYWMNTCEPAEDYACDVVSADELRAGTVEVQECALLPSGEDRRGLASIGGVFWDNRLPRSVNKAHMRAIEAELALEAMTEDLKGRTPDLVTDALCAAQCGTDACEECCT